MEHERRNASASSIQRMLQSDHCRPVLILIGLGLALRLIPAYLVYGSFDVGGWELVIRQYRMGINPYRTGKLNWPPLWPFLLLYTMRMEDVYGLPTYFAVKIIPCVMDTLIAVALYGWHVQRREKAPSAFRCALWYTLNPVAIATCALQGQFESLPSLFSLLAILHATRARYGTFPLPSALWLSLGGLAKTWPLFLMPAYLRCMRPVRQKAGYVLLAILPTILSVGALYLLEPKAILDHVLQYRGSSGQWGLTAWNYLLPTATAARWTTLCHGILYAAWIVVYALTWRRGSVAQVACLGILTFYVFTSACGPQYHAWVLAIGLLADFRRAKWHLVLAAVTLGIMYVYTPYNGELFNFVLRRHTPLFWATNMNADHMRASAILNFPLWGYCLWWWASLLRDILRQPAPEIEIGQAVIRERADFKPASVPVEREASAG